METCCLVVGTWRKIIVCLEEKGKECHRRVITLQDISEFSTCLHWQRNLYSSLALALTSSSSTPHLSVHKSASVGQVDFPCRDLLV